MPSRFTFEASQYKIPVWSSDGDQILFTSGSGYGQFNLFRRSSSGPGELTCAMESPATNLSNDWSLDGWIVYI